MAHLLPLGPIAVKDAARVVRDVLGVDSRDDRIRDWAAMRRQIPRAPASDDQWLDRYGVENSAFRAWVRRHLQDRDGAAIDSVEPIPPMHVRPPKRRGRPIEMAMDAANAELLRNFPQLEHHPLVFALLEALYRLDAREPATARFRPPRRWGEAAGLDPHASVRNRALRRLRRARQLLDRSNGRRVVE